MSTPNKAWFTGKILGLITILGNLLWLESSIHLYYNYHYTDILYVLMIPDEILILRGLGALVGITIGFKIFNESIMAAKWALIDLAIFLLITLIAWAYFL